MEGCKGAPHTAGMLSISHHREHMLATTTWEPHTHSGVCALQIVLIAFSMALDTSACCRFAASMLHWLIYMYVSFRVLLYSLDYFSWCWRGWGFRWLWVLCGTNRLSRLGPTLSKLVYPALRYASYCIFHAGQILASHLIWRCTSFRVLIPFYMYVPLETT